MRSLAGILVTVLSGTAISAGCLSINAISPERAAVEQPAIDRVVRRDSGTLSKIAPQRAKSQHPELWDRRVVCALADVQTTFTSETRAVYTASYVCGIAPWQPNQGPHVATPTIALELFKERGTWMINGFL